MLASSVEKGGAEELRIDRDEALALVGTKGSPVFPGFGHRVVRLFIPHRNVGHARGEIGESLVAVQGLQSRLESSELEEHHFKF